MRKNRRKKTKQYTKTQRNTTKKKKHSSKQTHEKTKTIQEKEDKKDRRKENEPVENRLETTKQTIVFYYILHSGGTCRQVFSAREWTSYTYYRKQTTRMHAIEDLSGIFF